MKSSATSARSRPRLAGRWTLSEAKLHLEDLVRLAQIEGPQRVSIRGRDSVVIVAADEFENLKPRLTGQALIDVLRASPHRDLELFPSQKFQGAVHFSAARLLSGVKGIQPTIE